MIMSRFCSEYFDEHEEAIVHYVVYERHVWLFVENVVMRGQHHVNWYSFTPFKVSSNSSGAWPGFFALWTRPAYIKKGFCSLNDFPDDIDVYENCLFGHKNEIEKAINKIFIAKSWKVKGEIYEKIDRMVEQQIVDASSLSNLRFQYRGGDGIDSFNCATWALDVLFNTLSSKPQDDVTKMRKKLSYKSYYLATDPYDVCNAFKRI